MKKRTAALVVTLIISLTASLFLGAEGINPRDFFSDDYSFSSIIFFRLRLPRAILCCMAGMLLGGAGSVFQMFFRNPLAEPGIMGISSGATLGAACALAAGSGILSETLRLSALNAGAFMGAVLSGIIIALLASFQHRNNSSVTIILCGTALGTLYSAFTTILLSKNQDLLSSIYMWMAGSFSGRGWNEAKFIFPLFAVSSVTMITLSSRLDLLCGGEASALSLGLRVKNLRIAVILAGALASSAAVCAGGTIGFVGLIAPHISRKLFSSKGTVLVPVSMVMGAVLMILSDTISRIAVKPAELPVGIVTSIMGVPFFLSIILASRSKRSLS